MTKPVELPLENKFYPCFVVISETGTPIGGFLTIADCNTFLRGLANSGESPLGMSVLDNRDHLPCYGESRPAPALVPDIA